MIEMIRAGYRSYGNRHAPFFAVWGLPAAQRGTAFCDIADAYAPILQTRRERLPYFDDAASGRIMECIDALAKRNLNDPQT